MTASIYVTVPAKLYFGLIEMFTTPTERLLHCDRGELLSGGCVRFELQPEARAAIDRFRLEGESYADAIERLLEVAGGRVS